MLLPPIGLDARSTDDGVLLTWADNPANPHGVPLRTQVYRWRSTEAPAPIGVGDHRLLDPDACAGSHVSYALLTIQLDRLENVEIRRSVLGDTVAVDVPVRFDIAALSFVEGGGSRVRVAVTDRRARPPARVEVDCEPGDEVGVAYGVDTGWKLESVEREPRDETVEVSVPVFAADGSRVVENGAPAFRSRNEARSVVYPILRLRDRCGAERLVRAGAASSRDESR
ncbi:MAG TPA: hypothetical protein VKE69_01625 [Planctomycetota bacterium]|nr:hypothetical protein [Planctomycetota bacterium]